MPCRQLQTQLEDWLEGKESPELRAHLRTCEGCRQLAAELRETPGLVAGLRQPAPTLDVAFWVRLRERIEAVEQKQSFWAGFNLLASRAAAVLAVALLLLSLLTLRQREPVSVTGVELAQDVTLLPAEELTQDQVLLSVVETEPRE
ncbi:MAG: zf-HC2 domain-containing protein [Acidobacteria bacterium]|nr:zf-HC2 domain-containing protein [Acidobacteriota bacterium]